MVVYFFNRSTLVKCYVVETATQWVSSFCNPAAGHTIYIVRITGAEVIAALVRRTRTKSLTQSAAQNAMAAFRSDFSGSYFISELTLVLIERAMDLAQMYGLCGYDAVQFAASLDMNAERRRYGIATLTLVSADTDL